MKQARFAGSRIPDDQEFKQEIWKGKSKELI